jgi:hypothetical protein
MCISIRDELGASGDSCRQPAVPRSVMTGTDDFACRYLPGLRHRAGDVIEFVEQKRNIAGTAPAIDALLAGLNYRDTATRARGYHGRREEAPAKASAPGAWTEIATMPIEPPRLSQNATIAKEFSPGEPLAIPRSRCLVDLIHSPARWPSQSNEEIWLDRLGTLWEANRRARPRSSLTFSSSLRRYRNEF